MSSSICPACGVAESEANAREREAREREAREQPGRDAERALANLFPNIDSETADLIDELIKARIAEALALR